MASFNAATDSPYPAIHLHRSTSPSPLTSSPLTNTSSYSTSLPPGMSFNSSGADSETSMLRNLSGRSSSSPTIETMDDHHHYGYHQHHGSGSLTSVTPQLVAIQEMEAMGTPTSSPILRPASGRFVGGVKKLLRLPSSGQAGVASSTVQADMPSVASLSVDSSSMHHPGDLEIPERPRIFNKVLKQIRRHPRVHVPHYGGFSGLRRHPVRRKARERHHYSDDGYTSDPGLLREVIQVSHEEEEEDDTESGDRGEARAEQIARIEMKLEKYKKLLQEEEAALQEAENVYVVGMEGSMNDKDQQRIKKSFINKQSKFKDEIDQLKRKVEHYEEQLLEIRQGRQISLSQPPRNGHKVRNQLNRIRHLGGMKYGMKHGIKILRRKKSSSRTHQVTDDPEDEEDEMFPEDMAFHTGDDMETESRASFAEGHMDIKEDETPCEYCLNEYNSCMEAIHDQKQEIQMIHQQYAILLDKLQQERDKTHRLENELNTLTDLHQNGIIELRGQLAQMERLTFSKNQDLEDNIENCQSRLHKLEVEVTKSDNRMQKPVATGMVRRVAVPFLSYLLDFAALCFKLSEHVGRKTFLLILILTIAIIVYYYILS